MNTRRKTQKKVSRTARKDGGGTQRHSAPEGVETLLFEVSAQDVALLKDDELRELVARLCQVTLLEEGLPTTCVTWGGDQREPDGGIDVRVQLRADDPLPNGSWLRWRSVGFQVKATEMPPAKIKKEMCPNGSLQSAIQDLLHEEGAYIIAAHDSVADQRYRGRVDAMRGCTADLLADRRSAHVDYYDSQRLANWVNAYPTVVAWVYAKKRGGVRQGWEPHGQWATSKTMPDGTYLPFLPDETARFVDPYDPGRKLNLIEGVERVRKVLRKGIERVNEGDGRAVRLVGLSGVGKTRFVQALFEADVGSEALNPALAVYADVGRETIPSPAVVLGRLISSKTRAVLIIDNCAPSLHRELVAELGKAGSKARVSLLTVEYDIREDLPEDTEVFRLEGGSDDLIERIIRTRFPNVTPVDADTIARFSNGNFRVAIALAESVRGKGSLAGLSDSELFDRLFWQRHGEDKELRSAAEVCALVYSFDGKRDDGELRSLACLADMSVQKLRRFVSELEKRGLVQKRGVWRAILPQAIANRLAADALEYVSYESIERQIVAQDPSVIDETRLLRSFSRRLGYLHDSEEAREIVGQWLSPDGLLGVAPESNRWSLYTELLTNVAPVDPEGALEVIERLLGNGSADIVIERYKSSIGAGFLEGYRKGSDPNIMLAAYKEDESLRKGRDRVITLIRLIAYYEDLFSRCLDVLLKFAVLEEKGRRTFERQGPACEILESMFFVALSGTLAKTDLRLKWLDDALRSSDEAVRSIACRCLSNALESQEFSSSYSFDFGARERDFGWRPDKDEERDWFSRFIGLASKIGIDSLPVSVEVRRVLARRFRILWLIGMKDDLRRAVRFLSSPDWEEGWGAIREVIWLDGERMEEAELKELWELEEASCPGSLFSRLRALMLGKHLGLVLSEGEKLPDWWHDVDEYVQQLGREFAQEEHLMPEAARSVTGGGQYGDPTVKSALGKSIAVQVSDMNKVWEILLEGYKSWPEMERDEAVLKGYLEGVYGRDIVLFNRLMDEAAEQKSLVRYIPFFQSCGPLDYVGRDRLLKVMGYPEIEAKDFECLAYSPLYRMSDDKDVAIIMEGLLGMDGAQFVVVRILSYYISECERSCDPYFLKVAYEVLEAALVSWVSGANLSVDGGIDFDVKRVVEFLFGYGVDEGLAEEKTRYILLRLVEKARVDRLWPVLQLKEAMKAIFRVQPVAALDILVGDDDSREARFRRTSLDKEGEGCPLLDVPEAVLNRWCRAGGEHRWIYVASVVPAIVPATGVGVNENEWKWSPQVVSLLRDAPNQVDVAATLVNRIRQCSWVGSGAEAISKRMPLLDQLADMLGTEHDAQIERWRGRLLGIRRSREKGEADYLAMQGFE